MKKSALSRSIELAKMAARVGLNEIRSSEVGSRIEQARILAEGLSQLKGAAMKAGQLLSIEVGDYFPKEAQEILSVLQNAAAPADFSQILKTIELEMGQSNFAKINDISKSAAASASIGQVHKAYYNGRPIALKVQYQGVADSIESDLKILKNMAQALCVLSKREMDLEPLFIEFQEVLRQEVNYQREAEYQTRFRHLVASVNARDGYYYAVPEVFTEYVTEKLLVMEWMDGITLKEWLRTSPSQEDRETIAHSLLNLYCYEFFDWGLVQTDPNYANYLVQREGGKLKLVLIDFGATREYDKGFVGQYINLLKAAASRDEECLISEANAFGLLDKRESEQGRKSFVRLMDVAIQPFFSSNTGSRLASFQFADEKYAQLSRQVVRDLVANLKYSPPPYRLIFLHRKLGGIFSILKNLEVEMDVSGYWKRMVGS